MWRAREQIPSAAAFIQHLAIISKNLISGNQRKHRAGPIKRACIPDGISEISSHLSSP